MPLLTILFTFHVTPAQPFIMSESQSETSDSKEEVPGDHAEPQDPHSSGAAASPKKDTSPIHREPSPQQVIRQHLTPYLPPPVIRTMDQVVDPFLEPYVGRDGSITLGTTIGVAWVVLSLVRFLSARLLSKNAGKAIADDDDHDNVDSELMAASKTTESYDATVLLCGPTSAGKTRLFYELCHGERNVQTLMSIKPNIGVVTMASSSDGDESSSSKIRYMDWPGHSSLLDKALRPILLSRPRIVLVLDATQPVAPAADCLDQLLSFYYSPKSRKAASIPIFVACHKKDFPKAKNAKRIQLQLRTELERILKVRAAHSSSEDSSSKETLQPQMWWPAGEPLEMDDVSFVQLHFVATTCTGKGSPELEAFCQTGNLPS